MVVSKLEKSYKVTLIMTEDEMKQVVSVLEENCDYGASEDLACCFRTILESSAPSKCENEDV